MPEQTFRDILRKSIDARLKHEGGSWLGASIRDRVESEDAVVVRFDKDKEKVKIRYIKSGKVITLPFFRDPDQHQPYGAFYTARYHDIKKG